MPLLGVSSTSIIARKVFWTKERTQYSLDNDYIQARLAYSMAATHASSEVEMPELDPNRYGVDQQSATSEARAASLPPADRGRSAWMFLAGCFIIEMLLWGFPFSFGVLNDYYTTHPPISRNANEVSAVGTTCSGIMYCGAPLIFAAYQRWPFFGRYSLWFGLPVVTLATFSSSFANNVSHLILTQGILYAIGACLLYYPIFMYIDEWFISRKGFAFGVMWGGSGCGGLFGPLVLNWGLDKYDVTTFLRGWSLALVVLIAPCLFFVKPRLPLSRAHQVPTRTMIAGFGFTKTRAFWILRIGTLIQGLGYFIPQLYLPTYARLHESISGSLLVSLVNVASVPGVVFLSSISDSVSVYSMVLISSLGSTLAVFLLWGLSSSSDRLIITFALCYGFFAGSFTATFAATAQELRRVTPGGQRGHAEIGSIFGLISMARGIGNIACGPLSEALLRVGALGKGAGAYSGMFGPLIVFTGTTAAITMVSGVAKVLKII
ncbi:hypothetical protein LTR10_023719 [Elasticomyces elasticus]|nr:hypothetical protein LTR10_023719 [Elasticomyces elasticus]KAK5023122.1 hypothetical protein LTR13_011328 [Exophiala sideris]KAK5176104.1 hypothetical protein LTR44_011349 [Eurotiomycetes sp. CCFEE 6388]